ncbi:MAG: hypothetical protein ABSG57_01615 [Candidatus Bathyarchaeia archaeon]
MSIESFRGDTFVAFLDICGFKSMMKNYAKAGRALDRFFRVVNEEVASSESRTQKISCIAVSDSAVAFVGCNDSEREPSGRMQVMLDAQRLNSLLVFAKNVAREMIQDRIAISGSIVYGPLEFQKRIGGPGMVKAMFLGKAYLEAYDDVEDGRPPLRLGQIRIKPKKKVEEVLAYAHSNNLPELSLISPQNGGYYFYWMLDSISLRRDFDREFNRRYDGRYDSVISVIRDCVLRPRD